MCGRYVMGLSHENFRQRFSGFRVSFQLPEPSWNITPTDAVTVLVQDRKQEGVKRAEAARWALTPTWSKTLVTKTPLFNARIETVLDKPSFEASARRRRCLIPAEGYYEWTGESGSRTPHFIHLPGEMLFFAGLYSWWHDPRAEKHEGWHLTTTMLTMDAYGPMQEIHHRIPVFMTAELWNDWLDPKVEGTTELLDAAGTTSKNVGNELKEHTVATLIGDAPELILPEGAR